MKKDGNKAKKVFFATLGCRLNQAETASLKQEATSIGLEIVDEDKQGDIIVINSCSVTDKAQRETEKILKKLKTKYPEKTVIITGCGAKKEHEKYARFVPNDEKENLFELLKKAAKKNDKEQEICSLKTRLMFKVQDGCNNFCSYCIVPYKRGRERSLGPKQILAELKRAEKQGFKEVVLCGVNIGRYSYDGHKLTGLIKEILKNTDFPRIRLSSINPDDFTEDLVRLWAQNSRLCPHFHVSLQSGSDKVLARMGRKYRTTQYAELISNLRKNIPDVQITTDIIVGIPGETEEEFADTVDFAEKMQFFKVHVFRYSKREGTKASKMPDQIPEKTKKERALRLQEVESGIRKDILNGYVGKEVEVLFEQEKNGLYSGFTPNYIKVSKKSKKDLTNTIVRVRVTAQTASGLEVK